MYVDEMWRARGVGGDTVVVAQSEPRRDAAPPLTCGGRAVGGITCSARMPRCEMHLGLAAQFVVAQTLRDLGEEQVVMCRVCEWNTRSQPRLRIDACNARSSRIERSVVGGCYRWSLALAASVVRLACEAGRSNLFLPGDFSETYFFPCWKSPSMYCCCCCCCEFQVAVQNVLRRPPLGYLPNKT